MIEQAKGAVSVRCGVNPDVAFERIRNLARRQKRQIHAVCAEVLAKGGRLDGIEAVFLNTGGSDDGLSPVEQS